MNTHDSIFVAGAGAMVGAAIVRALKAGKFSDVSTDLQGVDTCELSSVLSLFKRIKPRYVIDAGGKSGGIGANQRFPADLMIDNLLRSTNIIHAAHETGQVKLLYLASSCSYPKNSPQPMSPQSLLTGPLEPTNESYAVAKIAGLKLAQAYRAQYADDFIVGIPANPFGIGDDFSPEDSHVIGALLRRMHEAKDRGDSTVKIWGTGNARREFIFADDLASACLFVLQNYSDSTPINLGMGETLSIRSLANKIQGLVGYSGTLLFDTTYPDGIPEKSVDSSVLRQLGWFPKTEFDDALRLVYGDLLCQLPSIL